MYPLRMQEFILRGFGKLTLSDGSKELKCIPNIQDGGIYSLAHERG